MAAVAEVKLVSDLETKLSEIQIPWVGIAPQNIHKWLEADAKSHGTSLDLLLASMLPCRSKLIGNTTVKLFDSW